LLQAPSNSRNRGCLAPYVKKAAGNSAEAKKKYLAGLPKNQIFYVTIRLYDPSKKYEQVFIRVGSWKGETIRGILKSDLALNSQPL